MGRGRRLALGAGLLVATLAGGTAGFMAIERRPLLEALYMAVSTATTVGFGDLHSLSDGGKVFTIVMMVLSVGTMVYILTSVAAALVEGDLLHVVGGRVMQARIDRLADHFVLCGFGRVGEEIADEFGARGVSLVVVDHNPEALERAQRRQLLVVEGDATADDVLRRAGLERARGLIAASDSDAGNTFITLSAKSLNPRLFVIARVGRPENEEKLRRAGADRVVSPYTLAGRRMALAATQPSMLDFVDTLVRGRRGELILADLEVRVDSPLAGRTLESVCRDAPNVAVLAVRRKDGRLSVGPTPETRLAPGDQLVVLGEEQEVQTLGR